VCVCVGFVMCVNFGNMCTCVYCVLYCFTVFFALVDLCVCFVLVLTVLLPSDNSLAVVNNNHNNNPTISGQ
jgi:hypothetical protein